ncbi:MAG: hypothetical protein ACI3ZQ_05185 [Candidatus Cryptobacteroides sp.]
MISKRILTACAIVILTALNGIGQDDKWNWPYYDVDEKRIVIFPLHYYFTEQGDTLKNIPYVREYVECTIGRDSLKTRMKEIYYYNYNKHYEDYLHLSVYAFLLFDKELNVKEVRMSTCRSAPYNADKFQLDICNDIAELLKTTRWMKKEGFPDSAPYSFMSISFKNFYEYLEGDWQPY